MVVIADLLIRTGKRTTMDAGVQCRQFDDRACPWGGSAEPRLLVTVAAGAEGADRLIDPSDPAALVGAVDEVLAAPLPAGRRVSRSEGQPAAQAVPVYAGCIWCIDRPGRRSTRRTSMARRPTASLTHVPARRWPPPRTVGRLRRAAPRGRHRRLGGCAAARLRGFRRAARRPLRGRLLTTPPSQEDVATGPS